eukprot:scaffold7878_cov126-Isochrysis_galbana.AAC.16
MAPRQLRLEPMEVDSAADKGAKRVRVNSTEVSSTQVENSARAIACCSPWLCTSHCWLSACLLARAPALGMGCECSKDPFGSRSTPITTTGKTYC